MSPPHVLDDQRPKLTFVPARVRSQEFVSKGSDPPLRARADHAASPGGTTAGSTVDMGRRDLDPLRSSGCDASAVCQGNGPARDRYVDLMPIVLALAAAMAFAIGSA